MNDIEEMTSYIAELIFVFPYDIEIDREKIVEYNRFKYAEFQKTSSFGEHPYEDLDLTLTDYYWICSINNIISKNDFFTLVKIMIVEYESESFVSMLSDESQYFSIKSSNKNPKIPAGTIPTNTCIKFRRRGFERLSPAVEGSGLC